MYLNQLANLKLLIFALSIFVSNKIQAHPISFADSIGIMGYHSPILTHNQLNYSWEHWFATGVHHIKLPQQANTSATFATANFLLKRWNGSNYQGNLYAVVGGGVSDLSGEGKGAGYGMLQFDIEDRNYYFLIKNSHLLTDSNIDLSQFVIRTGLAPYVGKFDDIHTWIILEWQENQLNEGHLISDLTPYLRVFYKNILFEIGQSYNGITRFNYIIHF